MTRFVSLFISLVIFGFNVIMYVLVRVVMLMIVSGFFSDVSESVSVRISWFLVSVLRILMVVLL